METLSAQGTYLDAERFAKIGARPPKNGCKAKVKAPRVSDSALGYLATLVRHFGTLLCINSPIGSDIWGTINEKSPSVPTWLTASNLAFLVLVFQHYLPRWKWEASRRRKRSFRSGVALLATFEEEPGLYFVDGIAGKAGKARFCDLEAYFRLRFFPATELEPEHKWKASENMRRLLYVLRKLGPSGRVVRHHTSRVVCTDDIVGDVLHRIFWGLSR